MLVMAGCSGQLSQGEFGAMNAAFDSIRWPSDYHQLSRDSFNPSSFSDSGPGVQAWYSVSNTHNIFRRATAALSAQGWRPERGYGGRFVDFCLLTAVRGAYVLSVA